MYLKQIEQLVILQQVDNEIHDLNLMLEAAPKEVEELEAAHGELDQKRVTHLEKLEYLRAQEKRMTQEIDEDTLKIKKSKNKLMMVGNTREYHAMMREMDNLDKLNRMREEERTTLMEELSAQEAALKEIEDELSGLQNDLDAKRNSLAKRTKETEQLLADLNHKRQFAGKTVPPPILARYEFIRSRLPHPVIVPVEQGVCDGCHISIPPQSFIELQKGQQILSCPNCQRLIYWCEHFSQVIQGATKTSEPEAEEATD